MDEEPNSRSWTRFIVPTLLAISFLALVDQFLPILPQICFTKPNHCPLAKNDALQLRQAIQTYLIEYHRFPVAESAIEAPSHCFHSGHELMDVLLGSDKTAAPDGLNPRRITFFSSRKAKGNPPKSGVVYDVGGGGELFDPWGNHYRILIDLNRNNRLAPPTWYTKLGSGSAETIPQSVIAWSPGPDGDDETEDDNITTW